MTQEINTTFFRNVPILWATLSREFYMREDADLEAIKQRVSQMRDECERLEFSLEQAIKRRDNPPKPITAKLG